MKKIILVLFVLFALLPNSVQAQKISNIPIQNPVFELNIGALTRDSAGPYNNGPISGWTTTSGTFGLWQPIPSEFTSLPSSTVAYTGGGTLTQDLGIQITATATYTFTVSVGRRKDGPSSTSAYSTLILFAGTTRLCSESIALNTIPLGTFATETQTCTVPTPTPSGDLIISLTGTDGQISFDNIVLTMSVPIVPVTLTVSGTITFDNGTAVIIGPLSVQQEQSSTTFVSAGTVTSDSAGTVTGTIIIDPNFADANGNLTFVFGVSTIPNIISYTLPSITFQQGSTGINFKSIIFKKSLSLKSIGVTLTP